MLILISPAKTLDFDQPPVTETHSTPRFLRESRTLVKTLRDYSPADLSSLMGISAKLADLNYQRYTQWHTPFRPDNAKQAVLAFRGDVYTGLEADDWSEKDFAWAQDHLRILSGLYGLLRPLDLIQPYRLEMGTRLPNARGNDLYGFWGGRLTDALNETLREQRQPLLVNLASQEYFGAVDAERIEARIITPNFRELRGGKYRFVSFSAKKARGLMASWIVRERVRSAAKLRRFDLDGYSFNEALSAGDDWVFTRPAP